MAMGEIPLTVTGNLTSDPELKYTGAGAAMVKFTVASTPRQFDRESGQFKDGTATFLRCTAWRALAEHLAESVGKGARVIVSGRLRQVDWQTEQGENRSMLLLDVEEVGPSLRFATATPVKAAPATTGSGSGDPWTTAPAPAASGEQPPF